MEVKVYYNGKPFYGKAAFINGFNGYSSTADDGCLCASIEDRQGIMSCFDENGTPNTITNEDGTPIRLKHRRGISIHLSGVLNVSYGDEYQVHESYETGIFKQQKNTTIKSSKL